MRILVAVVAALSLVVGFAVAQASGVRALGAVVLVAGGLWCAVQLWRVAGPLRTVIVGIAYTGAFVLSHPLGRAIGTWTAVLVVAAAVGLLAWVLGAGQSRPTGRRVSTTSPPTTSTR